MSTPLETLLQHPAIWRPSAGPAHSRGIPTGYPALDEALPGGGWPFPSLIEILSTDRGIGELSLVIPVLRSLSGVHSQEKGRPVAWINPPYRPYPPALAAHGLNLEQQWMTEVLETNDALWAMEQSLRSGAFGAVLGWADKVPMEMLRRLKLAADKGVCAGFLFRAMPQRAAPSAASLRLVLAADEAEVSVELIKVQGGQPRTVRLPRARLAVV